MFTISIINYKAVITILKVNINLKILERLLDCNYQKEKVAYNA